MNELNKPKNPLIEQVAEKHAAEARRKAGEELVRIILPDFKMVVGSLIKDKVPAPKIIRKVVTNNNFFETIDEKKIKYDTILTASVPIGAEKTTVTISSSGYPKQEESDSAIKLSYEINVDELDSILIVKGEEATVQSKKWEMEPFTRHTPIGVKLPSWPSWSRKATVEDIEDYKALLDGLNQKGITFEGKTPPVIDWDHTEFRGKQVKAMKPYYDIEDFQ